MDEFNAKTVAICLYPAGSVLFVAGSLLMLKAHWGFAR
jgi:hypothetical protein